MKKGQKKECETCGEDGALAMGSPLFEARHFGRRALWDLHKLRQALETLDQGALAFAVSGAIDAIDFVSTEALKDDITH